MVSLVRHLLAVLLLPLALFAGTGNATELFRCSMDGIQRARCCCPETWAEPGDSPAFHRAPCCQFEVLELASQSPTPPSSFVPHLVPIVFVAPLSPFALAPLMAEARIANAPTLVEATATGPPLYLKNRSLLC